MTELENFDVDATLEAIESSQGSSERPMSDPTPEAQAAPTTTEYEFQWNGRNIKAPLDKIQQWASQGYDYSQKMAQFKTQQTQFEQMRQRYEPFREVDEYARQNQDWWNHVQKSYQERAQQSQLPEDLTGVIDPLKNELQEIKQWKNQLETERMTQLRQQEDQQLDTEIKSIREQYKDLDFDRVDEEGHTLEGKILDHAVKNGIKNFKTAFRDYMADDLVKRAEARGREAAVKERQENAKRGLLGKTPAPTKGLQPTQNLKSKSYDDILREVKEGLSLET